MNFGSRRERPRSRRDANCATRSSGILAMGVGKGSRRSIPHRRRPGVISIGNETLRTPAFGALLDVMHETRFLRFGAGKAHL